MLPLIEFMRYKAKKIYDSAITADGTDRKRIYNQYGGTLKQGYIKAMTDMFNDTSCANDSIRFVTYKPATFYNGLPKCESVELDKINEISTLCSIETQTDKEVFYSAIKPLPKKIRKVRTAPVKALPTASVKATPTLPLKTPVRRIRMEASEVRVGNIVLSKDLNQPLVIREIGYSGVLAKIYKHEYLDYKHYQYKDIKNEPFTELWAARFGFKIITGESKCAYKALPHDAELEICIYFGKDNKVKNIDIVDGNNKASMSFAACTSVSGIQNLFYTMTGEELQ